MMNAAIDSEVSVTKLKLWRLQRKLGQKETAKLLGLGLSAYCLIESGRMRPSALQLGALRRFFGEMADDVLQPVADPVGSAP